MIIRMIIGVLFFVLFTIRTTLSASEPVQKQGHRPQDAAIGTERHATVLSSSNLGITLAFELSDLDRQTVVHDGQDFEELRIPFEGFTDEPGKPQLPAVSRFVVVPPDADLELVIRADPPTHIKKTLQPLIFSEFDEVIPNAGQVDSVRTVYPPVIAEMSDPFVIRGVRLVIITTYPVRYDPQNEVYLHYDTIETEIRFSDSPPQNAASHPDRLHRSSEFLKFIKSIALNGDIVGRDDPDGDLDPEYVGHYLVVTHENCLEFAVPFIEWRRKSGWKVDILSLDANQANNTATIKNLIQERYDEYLDENIDPFDQVLMIGDYSTYRDLQPPPQWILNAPNLVNDWYYACLEGNDIYADVGISRWCSGSEELMELFVHRTLAYEAEPHMEDTNWFTRGAVYAQRWGRNYHISIASNVRWGKMVLESRGFDDIRVFEDMDNHGDARGVGIFVADQYNDGVNVMIGRAENYYHRGDFVGVNDNVIFPIDLYLGGHQEFAVWNQLRKGTPEHPKGPVAATSGYGNPETVPMNVLWLEMVSGFLQHDLTLGWTRLKSLIGPGGYFPNWDNVANFYRMYIQYYGDPGLQYWKGVPRTVRAQYPRQITASSRLIQVHVTDIDRDDVKDARVTLYIPGDMPDPDDDEYADYDAMQMRTTTTDQAGMVRFVLDDEIELTGQAAFITVTGRGILPFFGEIEIVENSLSAEVSGYRLTEVDGNGDDDINPGEIFDLTLIARNQGDQDTLRDVIAVVSSISPWVSVEPHEISFGDIDPDEEVETEQTARINIHQSCPDGESRPRTKPVLIVEFSSGESTSLSALELNPSAPNFTFNDVLGSDIIPTASRRIYIELNNIGSMDAPEVSAELVSDGPGIRVLSGESTYSAIDAGRNRRNNGERFRVQGSENVVPGDLYDLIMILRSEDGFIDTVWFELQVSEQEDDGPTGPDAYGYLCFDDSDEDWDVAPEYDWVEISRSERDRDFNGVECDFDGQSPHDIGETEAVDLGFETQFYGRKYDQVTIATNGFISMGDQEYVTNFQNWPLDRGFGGGVGMIAPFWDNLRFDDDSGVYYYYDQDEHRFIIEWYVLYHRNNADEPLTFQVILYDSEHWITQTGDQNILFQYKSIEDISGAGDWRLTVPYASVGISSPDGTTGINYCYNNQYPASSARIANRRALLFTTAATYGLGIIYGAVVDSDTGDPIPEADVRTEYNINARTDENGFYRIPTALAEIRFSISAAIVGYNDSTYIIDDDRLSDGDSLEINFELLHPEFRASVDEIGEVLDVGMSTELEFSVINEGSGPLSWQVTKHLPGNAQIDPWEQRLTFNTGEDLQDDRLYGVVFADDHFYVSGANKFGVRDSANMIYILNRNGLLVDRFEQQGESRYGAKDLAYDGDTVLWASEDEMILAYNLDGELLSQFEGPYNPLYGLAWDTDLEVLWACSRSTPWIKALSDEGQEIRSLRNPSFRIYGLAYWDSDPDGYNLYIFHQVGDNQQTVHKMNTETGDTLFVTVTEPEGGGSPIGAFITNQFDIYSWVFMAVSGQSINHGGDRIDVWQLDSRRDWFSIMPDAGGIIAPDEELGFTVTLDAAEMPAVRLEGSFVFTHNAFALETAIDVYLDVRPGAGQPVVRTLELEQGWNLVSLNIEPNVVDIEDLMSPLVEQGLLVMVKNGGGRFYLPGEFVNIEGWQFFDGYQMFLTAQAELMVRGTMVPPDEPIALDEGWNMKAFFPHRTLNPVSALSGIRDQLVISKNGDGQFYMPEYEFCNMEDMREGQGYMFKVTEPVELTYNIQDRLASQRVPLEFPQHFSVSPGSDNMTVLILGEKSMSGWELGVCNSSGQIIGGGRFDDYGRAGVAAWDKSSDSDSKSDLSRGEPLSFKIWDGEREAEGHISAIEGKPMWSPNGIFVGRIESRRQLPVEFGLKDAYPNPTNGSVNLAYGLSDNGNIDIKVFDLQGRTVSTLLNSHSEAGSYNIIWNTNSVPSGVYLVRLASGLNTESIKIAVVK